MKKILIFPFLIFFATLLPIEAHGYGDDGIKKEIESAFEEKKYEKALNLVKPFAEQGDAEAQFHLCLLNWHGIGTNENTERAIYWCEKSTTDSRNAKDFLEVVKLVAFEDGSSSPLNKSIALKRLKEKEKAGDAKSQWLLYLAHDKHLISIGKIDKDRRDFWLALAAANNYPDALIERARKWLTSDDKETQRKFIDYMQRAASQGEAEAMYLLGRFYQPWDSQDEKPYKDYEKATYWYRKSVQADGSGIFALIDLLRNRKNPVNDFDESIKWLSIAATDGDQDAQIYLASLYEDGDEVPRDLKVAFNWYKKATEHGIHRFNFPQHSTAHFKTARYFLEGKAVPRDIQKALKHLRKISLNENANKDYDRNEYIGLAQYYLGVMYEKGVGVKKDPAKAKVLFQLAAKHREMLAIRRLDFLRASSSSLGHGSIASIQTYLNKLGYKSGTADGVFGERTFNGLRAYQCANNMEVDGVPTNALLQKLKLAQGKNEKKYSAEIWNEKLFEAIPTIDIDCVTAALANGANANAVKYRSNPLGRLITAPPGKSMYAQPGQLYDDRETQLLETEIANLLVDYGTKPNSYNSGLFFAISNGNTGFLKVLLDGGVSPLSTIDKKRLIEWTAYYNQPEIEALLIEYGATPISKREKAQERLVNSPSFDGGGILLVKEALAAGAYINMPAADGATVLISAVSNPVGGLGAYNFLKFLLENGADPNLKGSSGFRDIDGIPLQLFIVANDDTMNSKNNDPKVTEKSENYAVNAMKLLLQHGAHIASRDSKGRTPLHWAAESNNLRAAEMLLDAGAILAHRDSTGASPLDYAKSSEMIAVLKGKRFQTP
jgi:TPR repeat protein/ankyrin repeat protein